MEAALLLEQVQNASAILTQPEIETLSSPVGTVPRGALTEISGPAGSGRTTILCSLLAKVTQGGEFCALIDTSDAFDPATAAAAGVKLSQVLWIRCGGNIEHALKSADWLTQGGGFGLVALDFGNVPVEVSGRIPLAAWFRLRAAVEKTRTALVVVAEKIQAASCSALKIELERARVDWKGRVPGRVLEGIGINGACVRRHRREPVSVKIMR